MSNLVLAPVKPVSGYKLTSTNGIGNLVVLALLALGAAFGIGEDLINSLIAAAVPFGFFIREILEGTRKPRWAGNIATYFASAIILVAPALTDVVNAASPIADAIANGNFDAIWIMLIPVVNSLLVYFKGRKSDTPDTPEDAKPALSKV